MEGTTLECGVVLVRAAIAAAVEAAAASLEAPDVWR
jgi:hypothetical protein